MRQGRRIAIETLEPKVPPRRRGTSPFAKVPLTWAAKAAKATHTKKAVDWVHLHHSSWKAKNPAFPLSNGGLRRAGIGKDTKYRALRELEQAGLIAVRRQP